MYFHHLCVVALSLLLQSTTARRLSLPDKAYYVKPKGSLFTKRSAQEVISKLGLISNPEKGSYIQTFGRLREVQQPLCQHRNLLPPRERRSIYLAPCSWCDRTLTLLFGRSTSAITLIRRWSAGETSNSRPWYLQQSSTTDRHREMSMTASTESEWLNIGGHHRCPRLHFCGLRTGSRGLRTKRVQRFEEWEG